MCTQMNIDSCIPLSKLIELADSYNLKCTDKIKMFPQYQNSDVNKYKHYLVRNLCSKLKKNKCKFESIFKPKYDQLKLDNISEYIMLNTLQIDDVMSQLETKYLELKFLGTYPLDFAELNIRKINDVDYEELIKSGKTKFAIVINLDTHDMPGSQWVAIYIDILKGHLYYFDQYDTKPPNQIKRFINILMKQLQVLQTNFQSVYNKKYNNVVEFLIDIMKVKPFDHNV